MDSYISETRSIHTGTLICMVEVGATWAIIYESRRSYTQCRANLEYTREKITFNPNKNTQYNFLTAERSICIVLTGRVEEKSFLAMPVSLKYPRKMSDNYGQLCMGKSGQSSFKVFLSCIRQIFFRPRSK